MKTRAASALFWIFAMSGILPATDPGSGLVQDPPTAYDLWETSNGISGAGATADSDDDGISNGIEFVIGGDPSGPDSDSNSLLPKVTVDVDYMNFIFHRIDAASEFNPFVEYSSSLGQWFTAFPGVDGVFIDDAEIEPGVTLVTVSIPRALASGSAFFGRLCVDITPP